MSTIQLRHGEAAGNPVLALAEPGFKPSTGEFKIGDGATPWNSLPAFATVAQVQAIVAAVVDAAPGALDTLNELAAALGDDANFAATVTAALAGLQTAVDAKQPKFMTGTVATAGATAAKTVTLDAPWAAHAPVTGDIFLLTLTNGNSVSSPTVAINGTTARAIRTVSGGTDNYHTLAEAGAAILLRYDGTVYRHFNPHTWYAEISAAEIVNTAHSGLRTMTGRRAEDLMVNEAAKARVLQNKTISGSNNTINNLTSSAISDLAEAVQDIVAAFLTQGTNVTLSYNDAGNTLTVSSTGGGSTDPEVVRDTIGVALVGLGLINIVVNDGADTITFSTTATANDTDANLKNRANHTGQQTASTISDFATAADARVNALAILRSLIDAKGDLIVGSANDTPARLPAGTNGHVLTLDSAEALGVKWAAAAGGGSLPSYSAPLAAVTAEVPVTVTHNLNSWDVDVEFQRSWLVAGALTATVRGEVIDPPKWRKVSKNAIEFDTSENWAANEFIVRVRQFAAAGDTAAPTAGVLSSPTQGTTTIDLSIAGATDAVGVAGIDIYRAGTLIATLPAGTTTYQDTGRTPSTAYSYYARIFDLYGNEFQTNTITPSTATPANVAFGSTNAGNQAAASPIVLPSITVAGVSPYLLVALAAFHTNWGDASGYDVLSVSSDNGGALTLLGTRDLGPSGQKVGSVHWFGKTTPAAGAHNTTCTITDPTIGPNRILGLPLVYNNVAGVANVTGADSQSGTVNITGASAAGNMSVVAAMADTAPSYNGTQRGLLTQNSRQLLVGDRAGAASVQHTASSTGWWAALVIDLVRTT